MDSRRELHWAITAIGDPTTHRGGSAVTRPQAWLVALTAGRTALLAGDVATLAVSIGGQLEAMLDPSCGADGVPDAAAVTAELLEMYQNATADEALERLIAGA